MSNIMNLPTNTSLQAGISAIQNKISAWLGRVNTALAAKGGTAAAGMSEIPRRIAQINNVKKESRTITLTSSRDQLAFSHSIGVTPKAVFVQRQGTANNMAYRIAFILGLGGGTYGTSSTGAVMMKTTTKPTGTITQRLIYMDDSLVIIGKPIATTSSTVKFGGTYTVTVYAWDE